MIVIVVSNPRRFLEHGDERGVSGRARPPPGGARSGRIDCEVVVLMNRVHDRPMPFGGCKQSGIGREMGRAGFEECLETKAIAMAAN
jgi:aldehyde dehydrogenase (NAD+)